MGNDYFHIELVGDVLRLTRTAHPMSDKTDEIQGVYDAITRLLRPSAGKKALIDLRGGPVGRSDAVFESVSSEATRRMTAHFSKVAVLVRSAAGKLQVKRLSGNSRAVFQSEAAALAYLASEG